MTIAQLAALIKGWLGWAVGQTVGQMKDFLNVTIGEVQWVAAALGYPSAPVNFSGIVGQLDLLQSNVDTLETQVLAIIASIAALGGPQQATNPVILPTIPPTGYGGGLASGDTDAIWNYQFPPGSGNIMGDQVNDAAFMAENFGQVSAEKHPYADYVRYHFDYSAVVGGSSSASPPIIDPSTILATDANVVDWLNRTDTGGFVWQYLNNLPISYTGHSISDEWWVCDISDAEFRRLQATATTATPTAPVWPGLAKVTLGTPVALSTGLTIAVPMDGVIIELTSVPTVRGFFDYDGLKSYRNLGSLTFVDDNSDAEYPQTLGFTEAVYCPKVMTRASAVKLRTGGGVVGTITPWLIT